MLVCHGQFDTTSTPIVHINDTTLSVTSHTASVIRAPMPIIGHGSCGPIWIETNGHSSNQKLVTYWHIEVFEGIDCGYSDGGQVNIGYEDYLHLRVDMTLAEDSIQVRSSLASKFHHWAGGSSGAHGSTYGGPHFDSSGVIRSTSVIYKKTRLISHGCLAGYNGVVYLNGYCQYPYPCDPVPYDSMFAIIPIQVDCNNGYHCFPTPDPGPAGWRATSATEFPPPRTTSNVSPDVRLIDGTSLKLKYLDGLISTTLNCSRPSQLRLDIFDVLGRSVLSVNRAVNAGENSVLFDLHSLPANAYFAHAVCDGVSSVTRFVVQ